MTIFWIIVIAGAIALVYVFWFAMFSVSSAADRRMEEIMRAKQEEKGGDNDQS